MYRLGYIDEDPGQISNFYQSLKNDFEVVIFEISEDTEIQTLVEDIFHNNLDILVLDYMLDENGLVDFNADLLIDKIQERNLYYPLVVLTSHEPDALDNLANANLVNGKEEMLQGKIEIFKQKLNKIASSYRSYIAKVESELAQLEKKHEQNEDGLAPKEEDRYVELNNFLDNVIDSKGRISRTFYSIDTNKKLDELIRKSEEIIKKIPDYQ